MFSNRSIAQEITIDRKTVLIYLHNTGFNTNLDVWMLHKKDPKKKPDGLSFRLWCCSQTEWSPPIS